MPKGIYQRLVLPNAERFWKRAQMSDGCWEWNGPIDRDGYGNFSVRISSGVWKLVKAHRFAYELLIGPIPRGLVLDHIKCNNPGCVNPGHTKPTTNVENAMRGNSPFAINSRKTHCAKGHAFSEDNTGRRKTSNQRYCRTCKRESCKKWYYTNPGNDVR